MRILVDKNDFNTLVTRHNNGLIQKIGSYKKSKYYVLVLSKSGIMRHSAGRLENVLFNDGETRLITFNNKEFIGDTSYISYVPNTNYQLPTHTTEVPITHMTYKLQKNSVVSLNYERLGSGLIRDAWFEIDDGFIDNEMAMEDIDTFLYR